MTNKLELSYGDYCPQVTYTLNYDQKYKIKFSTVIGNAYLNVDSNTLLTSTQNTTISNLNVMVFTNSYMIQRGDLYTGAKLYSDKIYDSSNNLVRDFIPAVRKSDGEAGLYDKVNEVFYTNAGTGAFNVPN